MIAPAAAGRKRLDSRHRSRESGAMHFTTSKRRSRQPYPPLNSQCHCKGVPHRTPHRTHSTDSWPPRKQHRGHTPAEKLTRHVAQQESTQALSLNTLKRVDLIQLPGETRHAPIVRRALRESHQLAIVVLDDETKPAAVGDGKRVAPLSLSQLVGWATGSATAMRLVERLHMQSGQRGDVVGGCVPNAK